MDLIPLGWNPSLSLSFKPFAQHNLVPGRVVREDRQSYSVLCQHGEFVAEVSGRMRHEARSRSDYPAVGDWVALQVRPAEGRAVIHALLPRRSRISRKVAGPRTEEQVVAANVDTVFLVSGLDGDFNPRRVERALAMAWESGASPVIVLNKADIAPDLSLQVAEVERVALGVPVHVVSAGTGQGLDALRAYIRPGETVVLVGSSGVGKSSLINSLLGSDRQKVAAVREDDSAGRHTTTRRELLSLPGGGLIIDSPGIREIQLWGDEGDDQDGLDDAFEDIAALAERCRFRDCRHHREPGCAVRKAMEDGTLDDDRWKSYLKLRREMDFMAQRVDERARQEAKQRNKKLSQFGKMIEKSDKYR